MLAFGRVIIVTMVSGASATTVSTPTIAAPIHCYLSPTNHMTLDLLVSVMEQSPTRVQSLSVPTVAVAGIRHQHIVCHRVPHPQTGHPQDLGLTSFRSSLPPIATSAPAQSRPKRCDIIAPATQRHHQKAMINSAISTSAMIATTDMSRRAASHQKMAPMGGAYA